MSLSSVSLLNQVSFDFVDTHSGRLLVLSVARMLSLHAEFRLVDKLLLKSSQFSCSFVQALLAKVIHGEFLKGNSGVGWRCKDKVGLTAQNDHKDTNIELFSHV